MPLDFAISDLTRLDKIQSALAQNDPRRQFAHLGMSELTLGDDAVDALVPSVERLLRRAGREPGGAKIRLIADPVAIMREGRRLKDLVFERLAEKFEVQRVTLDDGHPVLHASDEIQDEAAAAAEGADCIVTVGGGTITDIGKIAAMRASVPAHVVVQTAASVDGFTDNFSVVLQKGVKRTLLTRWPDAVLTDTTTIAEAPHLLNASGFGELLSLYVAPGDWYLASKVAMDDTFTPVLVEMLGICADGVEQWSAGVGRREPEGVRRLAAALAMRGIVTGVGGTTAALSGMEHLISHMLDIHNAEVGEPTGLHGAQVGVASVIAAAAWETFCARMDEAPIDPEQLFGDPDAFEVRVRAGFGGLDPTGRLGAECWKLYRQKLVRWTLNRDAVLGFFRDWPQIRAARDAIVLGPDAIAACLHQAKAPKRASDLGTSPDLMRWAVSNCQFMRERFTLADLLTFAGWWDYDGVSRVLDRVETALAAAEARS